LPGMLPIFGFQRQMAGRVIRARSNDFSPALAHNAVMFYLCSVR
jgi:hypothetical protein